MRAPPGPSRRKTPSSLAWWASDSAIRQAQGMSLADVEARSGASGARRRSARTSAGSATSRCPGSRRWPSSTACRLRVARRAQPVDQPPERRKIVLDLEALRAIDPAAPMRRFVHSIIEARGDFNGKVLSLRHDDLKALCTLVGGDIPTGVAQLRSWGVMVEGPEIPDARPIRSRQPTRDHDPAGLKRTRCRRRGPPPLP